MSDGATGAAEVQRRVMDYVDIDDTGCWIWTGTVNVYGYGRLGHTFAHRTSYEAFVGPIPDGLEIDHLCRVRKCVNPAHLEAVTGAENKRRQAAARTHCKYGHEFTPENTRLTRKGTRICRTCDPGRPFRPDIEPGERRGAMASVPTRPPVLLPATAAHGTVNAYSNHYCRCDLCRTARRDHRYEYVLRRRANGGRPLSDARSAGA